VLALDRQGVERGTPAFLQWQKELQVRLEQVVQDFVEKIRWVVASGEMETWSK